MTLRQVVYRSREAYAFDPSDVIRLLLQARTRNRESGLTGLLLYRGGTFMQLLEGDAAALDATFARIRDDARHRAVELLLDHAPAAPLLPRWSMGYAHAPVAGDGRPVFDGLGTDHAAVALLDAVRDDAASRPLRAFLHGDG